jgi:glycosyltransferase involved in cell wall biosynthesis
MLFESVAVTHTPKITVVIPSFDSARTLSACLSSVAGQQTGFAYHVLVVHSGPEQISSIVLARFQSVQFQISAQRWLPGKARNWAVSNTDSEWILFLDSDCVADSHWLESMLRSANKWSADGVGGSVLNGSGNNLYSWAVHLLEFADWLPSGTTRRCQNFPSCNALYKRALLLEAGGFPEDVFPCEDSVLNYSLIRQKRRLIFEPVAVVSHVRERDWCGLVQHSRRFGCAFGVVRRRYGLPETPIARLPPVLLVPVAAAGRLARIVLALFPRHPTEMLAFVACFPFLLSGLVVWALGYETGRRR